MEWMQHGLMRAQEDLPCESAARMMKVRRSCACSAQLSNPNHAPPASLR
jgi:hypothetical protein